jgi:uncharacterized RDD family membrane protein YckC
MSSDPTPPRTPLPAPRPLSPGAMALAGLLLLVPLVALALVPTYAKDGPHLWGFPFFYWYQFLWVFLASAFTFAAYQVIARARRGRDR